MTKPSSLPASRYHVYAVSLSWGETRYFAARLEDASSPVYYWGDDEWVVSQWQTADFRHDETRAAAVVLDEGEDESDIDEVEVTNGDEGDDD